jgi:hypothetical protein
MWTSVEITRVFLGTTICACKLVTIRQVKVHSINQSLVCAVQCVLVIPVLVCCYPGSVLPYSRLGEAHD